MLKPPICRVGGKSKLRKTIIVIKKFKKSIMKNEWYFINVYF